MFDKIGNFFTAAVQLVKDEPKAVIAVCGIAAAVVVFLVWKGVM